MTAARGKNVTKCCERMERTLDKYGQELEIRNGTFKKGKFDTFEHYEKRVMKNLINPHIIHDL